MGARYLIAAALLSFVVSGSQPQSQSQAPSIASLSPSALKLEMRKLWGDRAVWTRAYIVAALDETPDAEASADRLLKTDEEIAHALSGFYGSTASENLKQALRHQSTTLTKLARVAKASAGTIGTSAGDPTNMAQLLADWHHSRDTIDAALQAGGGVSNHDGLSDALQSYLSSAMKELEARVNRNWNKDTEASDDFRDSAMAVADEMSNRVVAQFPQRFTPATGSTGVR